MEPNLICKNQDKIMAYTQVYAQLHVGYAQYKKIFYIYI